MNALLIGSPGGLADAVARALRQRGTSLLQAIPADAADPARARWILDEAGDPGLVIVIDTPPYATVHELLALTRAEIVLVAEQRGPLARPGAVARRSCTPRDEPGLTVVPLGRAGRRWFQLGGGRQEPLSAARAAAVVLRSCGAGAASFR